MKNVNLRNPDIIDGLESMRKIWWDDISDMKKVFRLTSSDAEREKYISEEYMREIMNKGHSHDGFPEELRGYNLKTKDADINDVRNDNERSDKFVEFSAKYRTANANLQSLLGTFNNALAAVYPPEGFISWHNNANASAYNLVCTWSETGDGYWQHFDQYENKVITVKDKPGWQVKAFYFGSYTDNPKDIVYHAASTDCWRMTVSYIFDRHNKEFWEDVIEEMECEN